MVLDLDVELITFLFSVDDLSYLIALSFEQVSDKSIIETLFERLKLLRFLLFTKASTRFVQLNIFTELLEKLKQVIF